MTRAHVRFIVVGSLLFLFFVVLRLPYGNIFGHIWQKVYRATGVYISGESTSLNLLGWPGISLKKFVVVAPLAGTELEVTGDKLIMRAGLGGLFPPRLQVSTKFINLKKGGDGYVRFVQPAGSLDGSVDIRDVELDQLHPSGIQRIFTGKATLYGNFSLVQDDPTQSSGTLELELKQFKIHAQNLQGIVIPTMNFGKTHSKIQIRNGVVELGNFQFGEKGSDLEGSLTGEIRLNKEFARSFLAIVLKIKLSEGFIKDPSSETITSFLSTFKTQTPNEYAMKWNSTFIDMTTNVLNAIPQKL